MEFSAQDWKTEWPNLLARIESDQLTVLKRSRSGDVLEGEAILGGKPISVIIKRPKRKYVYRTITGAWRLSRAWRIWIKAWKLLVRNIACEWPLLVMEKRTFGYVTDAIIVLEKVSGQTLGRMDLDAIDSPQRQKLFYRLGRTLRRLEFLGFTHFDAKSTNWVIRDDPQSGPTPILVDVDSVRHYLWISEGIRRLLRSMKDHPQYTPEDSLELCRGYAPRAQIVRENSEDSAPASPAGSV